MTDVIPWTQQVKRLDEVRERDKADEVTFLTRLREKHEECEKTLTLRHRDVICIWESQMETLISSDRDRDWLKLLLTEYRASSQRSITSFKTWMDKLYHTDSMNCHIDMEKTLRDATKKFTGGINSADRLEALIMERHAMLFRQRVDLLCRRDKQLEESVTNNMTSMVQVQEMFTRIFQSAIA